MAETQTPNFKWTKPDIGGDSSTWGNVLNTTFDAIDSVAYANQQSGVPIGSIVMYAGSNPPAGWLWCLGQVYADTDVPNLVPILKHAFPGSDGSHTALPNLGGRTPVGYDGGGWAMGAMAGEVNHTLLYYEVPSHTHSAWQAAHTHYSYQDVHVHAAWQDAHAHTVGNTQAHSHVIVTGNHSHGVTVNPHVHGGSLMRFLGGSGQPLGVHGGVEANTTYGNTDSNGANGATDTAGNLGGYTDTQALAVGNTDVRTPGTYTDNRQPAVHVDTQTPAVATGSAGNDYTHNNMQPYTVVGFIIRYY